jgi:hypothetical protein
MAEIMPRAGFPKTMRHGVRMIDLQKNGIVA